MGEIRRSLQEAAMGVSGQGEKSLSAKTHKTKMRMQFGRLSIDDMFRRKNPEMTPGNSP